MSKSLTFLSPEFLAPYKGKRPEKAGVLFDVVYLRTYSRWLEEEKRRERWDETLVRVVNHSLSLYQGSASHEDLVAEAELLYDRAFNLHMLPAGRSLWIGGTKAGEKFQEANMNCSFDIIDSIEAFGDLFHLLLCGCGTGFRVLPSDVELLPTFNTMINLVNEGYEDKSAEKKEHSVVHMGENANEYVIRVGDSREGWVEALREFLALVTDEVELGSKLNINICYDYIRPAGARITGFGGKAPGPNGLMDMFSNITKVINKSNGLLTPVECMDIMNYIGKNVIVGGTRRSSQVTLGSLDDEEFVKAKENLWLLKANLQRTMSNNSVVFTSKATREQVKTIFSGIKNNGEPGFFNLFSAQKRRPNAQGANPCVEIILDRRGFCNLSTVNLHAFVNHGHFDHFAAMEAIYLATRVGLRMTNITVSLPKWDHVQKRDRLLGVSMTGVMEAFDALGWEFDSKEAIELLKELRAYSRVTARDYAFEMRVPCPLLVTAIKPEGTISLLPTVSSGLHAVFAPYYIRRIRVSSMDPVSMALKELGVPNEPDQSKPERDVFSFPIKTSAKRPASDETAIRQFERYLTMMEHYVDHNASCTLTVGPEEWDGIEEAVYQNFDKMVACAFLPKFTDAYPQMPMEEITQSQYEEMMLTFPDLSPLHTLTNKHEQEEAEEDELDASCDGGHCPIR